MDRTDALWTAIRGVLPDADELAAAVAAELGEPLQATFDADENVTVAARRLHLATRTVAYRLERIESLLGHRLDGEHGRRLSAAPLVLRLRSVD